MGIVEHVLQRRWDHCECSSGSGSSDMMNHCRR